MPSIDTLVDDIYDLLERTQRGASTALDEDLLAGFGVGVAKHAVKTLSARRERRPDVFYPSELGQPCSRKLWFSVNKGDMAADVEEEMQGHTLYKFFFGDMVEESVLLLAKAAGHDVTNEQYLVTTIIDGNAVTGRMDAVIDNVLVDVKSCSPFGFKKFEQGLTEENDDFGYLTQLSLYNGATAPGFKRQGFLAVDKQNGRIGFFEVPWKDPYDKAYQMIQDAKKLTWPPRAFDDEPDGASGNRKLCTTCSYCPYKQTCWPGLKAYSYSGHPRFLTVVKRVPGVPEIELKKAA